MDYLILHYNIVDNLEVLWVGQKTKRCINPKCVVYAEIWGSVQWRQITQIGRQRQALQQP
jgi:hypothetical protein